MTADNVPVVVLLTEDEPLVRMYAAEVLAEDGGYKVLEAAHADEALTLLRVRADVRALCTDIDMPGSMDGVGLARIVDVKWPGIGIVVTSGRQRPGIGNLPTKARFLPKPYSAQALVEAVRAVAGGPTPIIVPHKQAIVVQPNAPVLPAGLKIDQPHTGIGSDGGLAQPLQEPEK